MQTIEQTKSPRVSGNLSDMAARTAIGLHGACTRGFSKSKTMQSALFKSDVEKAIKIALARLPGGTVAISPDCLWQLTRIHSQYGPTGTNAGWVARQVFNEIVSSKAYSNFVSL